MRYFYTRALRHLQKKRENEEKHLTTFFFVDIEGEISMDALEIDNKILETGRNLTQKDVIKLILIIREQHFKRGLKIIMKIFQWWK